MNSFLHLRMINKTHAYPQEVGVESEAWGRIIISHQRDSTTIVLLDTEWDLTIFSEWFMTNEAAIDSEIISPPFFSLQPSQASLAEILNSLHNRDFNQSEEEVEYKWFDYLYNYSTRHNLWNGLMGSQIPNILIGRNNGIGEISFYSNENKWHLQFNMEEFVKEVKQEITKFLLYWVYASNSDQAKKRARYILPDL